MEIWKTLRVSHIPTPPATTTDKCPTKRYTNTPLGTKDRSGQLAYEFKYKPGDLARLPPWVAPHQPRLDWQMWFAALGDYHSNPWILRFMMRLLEGSPEVVHLLLSNPFPDRPPRYLRAMLYQYQVTNSHERRQTGNWWLRQPRGEYVPVISLRTLSK